MSERDAAAGAAGEEPEVVGLDDVELFGEEAGELVARGRELYTAGELQQAAAAFADAAQLDPASFEAIYWLARALQASDRAACRALLDRAVTLRPEAFEGWRALAFACAADHDAAGVERALAGALSTGDARQVALERDVAAAAAL
jgi:tetratricopeptide (TPR) repeat protein